MLVPLLGDKEHENAADEGLKREALQQVLIVRINWQRSVVIWVGGSFINNAKLGTFKHSFQEYDLV